MLFTGDARKRSVCSPRHTHERTIGKWRAARRKGAVRSCVLRLEFRRLKQTGFNRSGPVARLGSATLFVEDMS